MRRMIGKFQFSPAVLALIFMNLIPLIGVLRFDWDAGTIVFLYWVENVVIGLLNIPKILSCNRHDQIGASQSSLQLPSKRHLFLSVFFLIHYGLFCFGHYMFLQTTYSDLPSYGNIWSSLTGSVMTWSILGLSISHLISMVVNFYGKAEYAGRRPNEQMFIPYKRIILLHIVIVGSAFVAIKLGQGLATLLTLVIIKILFDLGAHLNEHAKVDTHTRRA